MMLYIFIYSKHWVNVGMNHHVFVTEAAYKELGKIQGMIFSKTKPKKICNHNCFLYTVARFVFSGCETAAVEKCFNTAVLCPLPPVVRSECSRRSPVSQVEFHENRREFPRSQPWEGADALCQVQKGDPAQGVPVLQVPSSNTLWLLWLGKLQIFPGGCWKVTFFLSLLMLGSSCSSQHGSHQFHQVLHKQHPAVRVWDDAGEEQSAPQTQVEEPGQITGA